MIMNTFYAEQKIEAQLIDFTFFKNLHSTQIKAVSATYLTNIQAKHTKTMLVSEVFNI